MATLQTSTTHWHTVMTGGNATGEVSEPLANEDAAVSRANWLVENITTDEPEADYDVLGSPQDGVLIRFYDADRKPYLSIEVLAFACDGCDA